MSSEFETKDWEKPTDPTSLTVEAWSQGLVIGALIMMALITAVNMRRDVLLHKLILVELLIAMPDCFFIFFTPPAFGWYLSTTSALMIISWALHNIIAWMKSRPFLSPLAQRIYLGTFILSLPYWTLEIVANFAYFNDFDTSIFPRTRPFEALCRDPWWIFTTINLFWNIKHRYPFSYLDLIKISPWFGIMLLGMCIGNLFAIFDLLAVTSVFHMGGLNPFWKLAFIFQCFTDTIILDDFKTALDKLPENKRNDSVIDSWNESGKSRWKRLAASNEITANAPSTAKPDAIYVRTSIRITERVRSIARSPA